MSGGLTGWCGVWQNAAGEKLAYISVYEHAGDGVTWKRAINNHLSLPMASLEPMAHRRCAASPMVSTPFLPNWLCVMLIVSVNVTSLQ